jgi:very-short-patch-repair endonuclease
MRRAMTPEERMLWDRVRQNRLHGLHFRRQQVIAGFVVDFYCDGARLAIELDGAGHDAEYDAHRYCELAYIGIRVIRITNRNFKANAESILEIIIEAASLRLPGNQLQTP